MHRIIIDSFNILGYGNTIEGLCHGLSIRWIEAMILNEEAFFLKRIDKIASLGTDIKNAFESVKAKKGKNVTHEDRELLDIIAFYESLNIFHDPHEYSSLFNVHSALNQEDIHLISPIASSEKILLQGGLAEVYSGLGVYTQEEMENYLGELAALIDNLHLPAGEIIGILLGNGNHSIGLTYSMSSGWKCLDINQYPSKAFNKKNTLDVAQLVVKGFRVAGASTSLSTQADSSPLMTSVLTTGNNSNLLILKDKLNQFKQDQPLTEEKMQRLSYSDTIAVVAALTGRAEVIVELAKHKVDLNQSMKDGVTPAFVAAQNGHVAVIAELAKHKVDFNRPNKHGATPV